MFFGIRRNIVQKISELTTVESNSKNYFIHNFYTSFEFKISKDHNDIELHLPVFKTRKLLDNNVATTIIKKIVSTNYNDNNNHQFIKNIFLQNEERLSCSNNGLSSSLSLPLTIVFKLNKNEFIRRTLKEYHPFYFNDFKKNFCEDIMGNYKKNIVIEFSSPNIAKPFHVGHLRSTIIGNYIANLHKYLGNNVTKMNYLGDWGTQFGFLQIGVNILNLNDEEIKMNPIKNLYNAYVIANKNAKINPNIAKEARKLFTQLENGLLKNDIEKWKKYRQYTIDELKIVYERLGIEFDEYAWESQYNQKKIQKIITLLENKNLLFNEIDGRKIIEVDNRRIPIIKSDGSTLYLTRDIAALLDRYERHKFDKHIYVVDNLQTDHFNALFNIVEKIDSRLQNKMKHIKFGRIKGMSTRNGNVIFLKDVLDEAKNIMMQKQIQSPTTKVDIENLNDEIADILGISAVIVNDLKQRRQKDYDFSWDKVLQVNGDTGIKLQYTHCRLCNLIKSNINISSAIEPIPELLLEPEAVNLIFEISKFVEILYKSEENLESCILVNYLFSLSNSISRALKKLNVKNEQSKDIREQRMLLFEISKNILSDGMQIIGLKPLVKI